MDEGSRCVFLVFDGDSKGNLAVVGAGGVIINLDEQ